LFVVTCESGIASYKQLIPNFALIFRE